MFLLHNQKKDHFCNAPLIDVKEIPVIFSYDTIEDSGDKVTIARGYDGVLYQLIRCKNPLSKISSDDSYREPSNRRKVNRTAKRNVYIEWDAF